MREPLPQLNAMIICDSAFQQAPSGKWCVIGSYSAIIVREFPTTHTPFNVFLALSDFTGNTTLRLVVRDSDGDQVNEVRAQFPKIPITTAEFAMPFPPMKLTRAGAYTLEMHCGDTLMHMRSFQVVDAATLPQQPQQQLPQPPQPPHSDSDD